MIILVGNTKGGVGKTTVSVQLAIARARAGRDVWLIDADVQGTASTAIQERSEKEQQPGISCARYVEAKELRTQLKQQQGKFDDVIIDVGGRDTTALRAGLMLADLAIVPFAPMAFDVWAMNDMAKIVESIHGERDGLKVVAVMNQAEPRENSQDNADALAAVQGIGTFECLPVSLRKRKAFSVASSQGMGVHEMPAPDPKAVAELDRLLAAVAGFELVEA